MNAIERLRRALVSRHPGLTTEIDTPADPVGRWHLDIRPAGGPWIVVEWKPGGGFGVSTPGADDFGLKSDELYPDEAQILSRVSALVNYGGRTEPPVGIGLAMLRQVRGLTQAALAERAGVKQAAIARLEGRQNIQVSSLARAVEAMGGRLVVRAEFGDGTVQEIRILPEKAVRGLVKHMPAKISSLKKPKAKAHRGKPPKVTTDKAAPVSGKLQA